MALLELTLSIFSAVDSVNFNAKLADSPISGEAGGFGQAAACDRLGSAALTGRQKLVTRVQRRQKLVTPW